MARWPSNFFLRAGGHVMANPRPSVGYAAAMATNDPELIIGLVAPLGTSTTDLTKEI
jgi:cytidine deaminase